MLFQRHGSTLKYIDATLKMKQNPTSDFQRCTILINNVDRTFSQRCFNVASTLAKPISKPLGQVRIFK